MKFNEPDTEQQSCRVRPVFRLPSKSGSGLKRISKISFRSFNSFVLKINQNQNDPTVVYHTDYGGNLEV